MRRRARKDQKKANSKLPRTELPRTLSRKELDRVDGGRSVNQWIEDEIWQADSGG